LACLACPTLAAQERYDYDALGRLIRVIDDQGRVTEYVYDPAGNLLQVITGGAGGAAQTPTVASTNPNAVRRGETRTIAIAGSGFIGAHVSTPDPALDIANLRSTATQISFDLTAGLVTALGPQVFTISNAAGKTTTTITVNPVLPRANMSPTPIAVPPTAAGRTFFVSLSNADVVDHTINLASSNPGVATVAPASVTIPAGQTEVRVTVTGQTAGNAAINLTSGTLGATAVPVFVTAEFTGLTTSFAPSVGVVFEGVPVTTSTSTTISPLVSAQVGVAIGTFITSVAPQTLTTGSGPTNVVITGGNLQGITAVNVVPADGLVLGPIAVAPDGTNVTVPITVSANAPQTLRQLALIGAHQPYIPVRPDIDRLLIAPPAPEIHSLDPNFATAGTTAATLTVRGRNLANVQAITFTPAAGISIGTPVVSADGTTLTAALSVSPVAALGQRVVTVTTAAGVTAATPSPANTFTIASDITAVYTPISSSALGVVLLDGSTPPPQSISRTTSTDMLGVTFGTAINGRTPATGTINETVQLTFTGHDLQGVSALQILPPDGLTVAAPVISADARSVTFNVTIAASAPQTRRRLRVLAGAGEVPFSSLALTEFRITAGEPRIDSITPLVYQIGGGPVAVTIRGANLHGTDNVRLIAPAGVTVTSPVVDASGTAVTTSFDVAAGTAPGNRVIVLRTPGGDTAAAAAVGNTIQLVTATAGTMTPVVSPGVGVVFGETASPPPVPQNIGPLVSPQVGVVLQADAAQPVATTAIAHARSLGVVVGPYATSVQTPPLTPNTTGNLVISGVGLADVTAVTTVPLTGVTVGALNIASDGTRITVPITLTNAAPGQRSVTILRGTQPVQFAPPGANAFQIGVGIPTFASITPLFGSRGQVVTLTIRGQNFQGATAVIATPATGVTFDAEPTVNAAGTEATLRIAIAANAMIGPRVIQIVTPGGLNDVVNVDPAFFTFTVLE
jgi:YD repeat-containing protein